MAVITRRKLSKLQNEAAQALDTYDEVDDIDSYSSDSSYMSDDNEEVEEEGVSFTKKTPSLKVDEMEFPVYHKRSRKTGNGGYSSALKYVVFLGLVGMAFAAPGEQFMNGGQGGQMNSMGGYGGGGQAGQMNGMSSGNGMMNKNVANSGIIINKKIRNIQKDDLIRSFNKYDLNYQKAGWMNKLVDEGCKHSDNHGTYGITCNHLSGVFGEFSVVIGQGWEKDLPMCASAPTFTNCGATDEWGKVITPQEGDPFYTKNSFTCKLKNTPVPAMLTVSMNCQTNRVDVPRESANVLTKWYASAYEMGGLWFADEMNLATYNQYLSGASAGGMQGNNKAMGGAQMNSRMNSGMNSGMGGGDYNSVYSSSRNDYSNY